MYSITVLESVEKSESNHFVGATKDFFSLHKHDETPKKFKSVSTKEAISLLLQKENGIKICINKIIFILADRYFIAHMAS